ncbi:sacsin N-terminal ATP-binding-like domain-containing protein [Rhodocaloribacter sp.]
MGPIEKAIQQFRNKTLRVYREDSSRIVRDTRAARRAAKDHIGRWLFELLQNSDDAGASVVQVLIEHDTIYVADNGGGLKPKAVSAISGTDFSDKTGGTIGRKGIGFKSVYEVSPNPQVLNVKGEGIEFNLRKAKELLRKSNLNASDVPYQWLPFFITWDNVQTQDPQLESLSEYKTVVRLPDITPEKKKKAEQLIREWPPHALFAFRHLRKITASGLEIILTPGNGVWTLRDNREQTPSQWRVAQLTESPPNELLNSLDIDECRAISTDGVSFLIAAPLENDSIVPTADYLPIHVFYPTEEKGPVRLLLHAEFLVKSDRTALIPIDDSPFNAWVAEKFAAHVCKFVNDSYQPDMPNRHVALLVPFDDRESHPVARDLWQRIANRAKIDLRLADIEAQQQLTIDEARLISVSDCSDLARTLLEATSVRRQLLHPAFDDDKEAYKALKELDCERIHDKNLLTVIAENADSLAHDMEWVWTCWKWLAAWVARKHYSEEYKKRIEHVKALPIVPVNGRLRKASDLAGNILTWRPDADLDDLPDWLPLTFVDGWFRDRIRTNASQEPSIRKLYTELGIKSPGTNVIQRAVGRAIEQYWQDKQGDPERFLQFILEQNWHEISEASEALQRCPVPLTQPIQGEAWAEVRKAYFGRKWGNNLLEDLYQGRDGIAWVQAIGGDREHSILEWLGCVTYLRIIKDHGPNGKGAYPFPDECRAWQTEEFGNTNDRPPIVDVISRLDTLTIEELSDKQVRALLVLLARHWEEYYRGHSQATLSWFYYTNRSRRVRAFWWFQILHKIRPTLKNESAVYLLTDCWLPDKRTRKTIGDLLPVIDLDAFGDDKDIVQDWLISEVGLCTRIEQLNVKEWKELLSTRIPDKAPIERLESEERLRDKVTGWYTACLDTVVEQDNLSQNVFASCRLLCKKAESWQYVNYNYVRRYVNDDHDLATAFAEDVWLFHVPARLATAAVKYLGVQRLSASVRVDVTPGKPNSPLPKDLQKRLDKSLPFVWVWKLSQRKQDAETLSTRLKELKVYVVPTLKAKLSLNGVHHEVERRWHVEDNTIYLHRDHANEVDLARALAKTLDTRSEADFYENLLRCNNEHQRKEKLLSKGIADAEVERCLREYKERPDEKAPDEGEAVNTTSQPPQTGGNSPRPSDGSRRQDDEQPSSMQQGNKAGGQLASEDTPKESLRFKNANTAPYHLGIPPAPISELADSNGGGTGGDHAEHRLTVMEKTELEKTGREFATRELKKMGYAVEEMPPENPGFDLRATKDGEELRIEVKTHAGRATVVYITHRQYKEYLSQHGYRWELWNVEHLSENDVHMVVITRYPSIPDEALNARTLRVDLRKCQSTHQD